MTLLHIIFLYFLFACMQFNNFNNVNENFYKVFNFIWIYLQIYSIYLHFAQLTNFTNLQYIHKYITNLSLNKLVNFTLADKARAVPLSLKCLIFDTIQIQCLISVNLPNTTYDKPTVNIMQVSLVHSSLFVLECLSFVNQTCIVVSTLVYNALYNTFLLQIFIQYCISRANTALWAPPSWFFFYQFRLAWWCSAAPRFSSRTLRFIRWHS